jgi:hypothetical protein
VPIVYKSGSLNLLDPSGPVQACNGVALPFYLKFCMGIMSFPLREEHRLFEGVSKQISKRNIWTYER